MDMNGANYTGNGNVSSVNGWFKKMSGGKLDYSCKVYGYYRAKNPISYYDNTYDQYGSKAQELIREALAYMQSNGFDFSQLTEINGGVPLNVQYAGSAKSGWAKGLWAHQSSIYGGNYGGKTFGNYQITDMGSGLVLGTFVHENGHMLLGLPDLYPYTSGTPDQWVRNYCTMGYDQCSIPKTRCHTIPISECLLAGLPPKTFQQKRIQRSLLLLQNWVM